MLCCVATHVCMEQYGMQWHLLRIIFHIKYLINSLTSKCPHKHSVNYNADLWYSFPSLLSHEPFLVVRGQGTEVFFRSGLIPSHIFTHIFLCRAFTFSKPYMLEVYSIWCLRCHLKPCYIVFPLLPSCHCLLLLVAVSLLSTFLVVLTATAFGGMLISL
jgi:hypothetical protein